MFGKRSRAASTELKAPQPVFRALTDKLQKHISEAYSKSNSTVSEKWKRFPVVKRESVF